MSEYKDAKEHTYQIVQTVLATEKDASIVESEIMEALYKIFTVK